MFYVYFPDDNDLVPFSTRGEAETFARETSAEGDYCEVMEVLSHHEAAQIDLCVYNGVTPGIDCPAFV